jgi:ribonuclease HI
MGTHFEITFDGGSLGNPGKGYGSYQITDASGPRGVVRLDYSPHGEIVTNNQAEYRTLIAALNQVSSEVSPRQDQVRVRVVGDSQLVLNQLRGSWKVKHTNLKPLHAQASELMEAFQEVELIWRGRKWAVEVLGH